jgi:methylglutaconyl-CoA hydratase
MHLRGCLWPESFSKRRASDRDGRRGQMRRQGRLRRRFLHNMRKRNLPVESAPIAGVVGVSRAGRPGGPPRARPVADLITSRGMETPAAGATGIVLVERRGSAAFVTLNRPEAANALSKGLVSALASTFAGLEAELAGGGDLRAVVLTGAGDKAFCAGADLKERRTWTLDDTRVFLDQLNALMNAVAAFPRPVIAAINGVAFGGGLELALACDIRLAVEGAEMGLTEVRLGIIPGAGGTQRLARIAGLAVAKELTLTGRRIGAGRARELGLVSEVAAPGALVEAAARLAREIGAAAPLALAAAKRAIDEGAARSLAEGLAIERAHYEQVLITDDRNEGLNAFIAKRAPEFKGR